MSLTHEVSESQLSRGRAGTMGLARPGGRGGRQLEITKIM